MKWCKGHATAEHIASGVTTEALRKGNDAADYLCTRGAAIVREQRPSERIISYYNEAMRWYIWLVPLVAEWPKTTTMREKPATSSDTPKRKWVLHKSHPHTLWWTAGILRCSVCGRKSAAARQQNLFASSPCTRAADAAGCPSFRDEVL